MPSDKLPPFLDFTCSTFISAFCVVFDAFGTSLVALAMRILLLLWFRLLLYVTLADRKAIRSTRSVYSGRIPSRISRRALSAVPKEVRESYAPRICAQDLLTLEIFYFTALGHLCISLEIFHVLPCLDTLHKR